MPLIHSILQRKQFPLVHSLQKRAGKLISGGYKRTAGAAFNAELHLMPIHHVAQIAAEQAALRTVSIRKIVQIQRTPTAAPKILRKTKKKISPLTNILALVQLADLKNLETTTPFIIAPWEAKSMGNILPTDLEALINHERLLAEKPSLVYYSDGSGFQNEVGAAAVNFVTGARVKKYVGPLDLYSVYIGELVGISLALDLALDETDSYPSTSVLIFTDNQSAIKAINNPQGRSGQFLIEEIYTKARKLPLLQAIHWIPAHVGVPGNEWADKEVKAAAQLSAKRKNKQLLRREIQKQSLPTLRSGLLRISKKKAQKKWEEEWNTNSRGRDLY